MRQATRAAPSLFCPSIEQLIFSSTASVLTDVISSLSPPPPPLSLSPPSSSVQIVFKAFNVLCNRVVSLGRIFVLFLCNDQNILILNNLMFFILKPQ